MTFTQLLVWKGYKVRPSHVDGERGGEHTDVHGDVSTGESALSEIG